MKGKEFNQYEEVFPRSAAPVCWNLRTVLPHHEVKKQKDPRSLCFGGLQKRNDPWLLFLSLNEETFFTQPRVISVHSWYLTSLINLSFYRLDLMCHGILQILYKPFYSVIHLICETLIREEFWSRRSVRRYVLFSFLIAPSVICLCKAFSGVRSFGFFCVFPCIKCLGFSEMNLGKIRYLLLRLLQHSLTASVFLLRKFFAPSLVYRSSIDGCRDYGCLQMIVA